MFLVLAAGLALLQNLGSVSCRYVHIDDSGEKNTGARLTTASPTGPIAHLLVPLHGHRSNIKKKELKVKVIPYRDIEKKYSVKKPRKLYNFDNENLLDDVKENYVKKYSNLNEKNHDLPVVLVAAKKTKLSDDNDLYHKRQTKPDTEDKHFKYYKKVILLPASSSEGSTDGRDKSADILTDTNEEDIYKDYSGSDVDITTDGTVMSGSKENSGDTASFYYSYSSEHKIPNKTKQMNLLGSLKKNLKDGKKALQSFYRKVSNSKIKIEKRNNNKLNKKFKTLNKKKKIFKSDHDPDENKEESETDSKSYVTNNDDDFNANIGSANSNDVTAEFTSIKDAISSPEHKQSSSEYDGRVKTDGSVEPSPEIESYEINYKINEDNVRDSSYGHDLSPVQHDSDIYSESEGYTDYTSEDGERSDIYVDSKIDIDENSESNTDSSLSNNDDNDSELGNNSYILDSRFNSADSEVLESVNDNVEPLPVIIDTSDSSDVAINTNKNRYDIPRKFQRDIKNKKNRKKDTGNIFAVDDVGPSDNSFSAQYKEINADVGKDKYKENPSIDGSIEPSDDSVYKQTSNEGEYINKENIPIVDEVEPLDSSVYIDQNSAQNGEIEADLKKYIYKDIHSYDEAEPSESSVYIDQNKEIDADVHKNRYDENISQDGQVKSLDSSVYIDQNSDQNKEIQANLGINENNAITLPDAQMNLSTSGNVNQDSQQHMAVKFNFGKLYKSKESESNSVSEANSKEDSSSCCDNFSVEQRINNEKDSFNGGDSKEPMDKTLYEDNDSAQKVKSDSSIYIDQNPEKYVEIKADIMKAGDETDGIEKDEHKDSHKYLEEPHRPDKEHVNEYIIEVLPKDNIKTQSNLVRDAGNYNKIRNDIKNNNNNPNDFQENEIDSAVVHAVAKYIASYRKNKQNGVKNLKSYNLSFVFNK